MNTAAETKKSKPKKTPGQIVRTVLSVVLVVLLVLAIAFVMMQRLKGEPIFIFGRTVMWVSTDSMEPTIPQESYILTEKVSAENVAVGDVISFYCDDPSLPIYGQLNTHRVEEIVGDHAEFVTKGDNNYTPDKTTAKASNVRARYVKNLPVLSAFGRFFKTPAGLVCSFAVIILFIFALYIPDILKKRKAKKAEEEAEKQKLLDAKIKEEVEKMKQNPESGQGNPPDRPENG